jgi:histidinol dehydrogenase
MVQDKVAIDMPAGPSEVLVIADTSANPSWVAADLLAQAEHGPDSQVILASTGTAMVRKVQAEINRQIKTLPRKELAARSIANSRFLVFKSLKDATDFSNIYAPEHLILACKFSAGLLKSITNAGSVFLGNYSPESAGDYASGTNHTLPTNGNAAMYSGVSLDSFCKQITFQKLSKKGLGLLAPVITEMAQAEGLHAHSESVRIRMGKNIKLK